MDMKPKKIPMRKCVATSVQLPKGEMFRIVRNTEGEVIIDLTGKARGRGAYLSKNKNAINTAKKRKVLDKHLEVNVPDNIYDDLLNLLGDCIG